MRLILVSILISLAAAGCGDDSPTPPDADQCAHDVWECCGWIECVDGVVTVAEQATVACGSECPAPEEVGTCPLGCASQYYPYVPAGDWVEICVEPEPPPP